MDIVELGGIRLHLLRVEPGLPHEADRTHRELTKLAPAVIMGDVDTQDALHIRAALADKKARFEPGFIDALFAAEIHKRFGGESNPPEHPLLAAARYARDRRADFIPLRPLASRPGFLARHRMRKIGERIEAKDAPAFAAALAPAIGKGWDLPKEIETAHRRLIRALADGRAPVVAIVQGHRAAAYMDAARSTGRIHA